MRSDSMMPRLVVGLTLCGLLLIASSIGGSNPVAAMGGFGRMGGFGGRAMGFGGGPRQHMTVPRRGAGRVVGRPSDGIRGNTAPRRRQGLKTLSDCRPRHRRRSRLGRT